MSRLQTRFAQLKQENRAALVTFVTAGRPLRISREDA
ncbi:tryptophan synthase subunit alpha [Stenotrophomonas maltophilia]|nr:tryptophan synthase subunit alpha [Stenotrophomonas maltophilia]